MNNELNDALDSCQKFLIYGTGSYMQSHIKYLFEYNHKFEGFMDRERRKLLNYEVKKIGEPIEGIDLILVLSIFWEEIYEELKRYYPNIKVINPTEVSSKKVVYSRKSKIFCIGRNKTGTTSVEKAFKDLGYKLGNQRTAEELIISYIEKDFDSIIDYCYSADVFQDVPFSWPNTYSYLDKAFPNSKFILTERRDPEQWYNSITKFHSKLWADGIRIPTKKDLLNATYIFRGFPWLVHKHVYGIQGENTYDKDILINNYVKHNEEVKEYFKNRPNDLLIINVEDNDSYKKFCDFLEIESLYTSFPWENKTSDIKVK